MQGHSSTKDAWNTREVCVCSGNNTQQLRFFSCVYTRIAWPRQLSHRALVTTPDSLTSAALPCHAHNCQCLRHAVLHNEHLPALAGQPTVQAVAFWRLQLVTALKNVGGQSSGQGHTMLWTNPTLCGCACLRCVGGCRPGPFALLPISCPFPCHIVVC